MTKIRHIPHILRNTSISVAIIIIGGLTISYFTASGVPRAFLEERIQAAGAANNAAVLINSSIENLKKIEQFEAADSNEQALDLISFEISQKQEKQNAAVLLASHLEVMANAAKDITSNRARNLAIESVTIGVSMVSRLVTYNNSVEQLFSAIQYKIINGNVPDGTNLRGLIAGINANSKSINDLSRAFNAALEEFDKNYGA